MQENPRLAAEYGSGCDELQILAVRLEVLMESLGGQDQIGNCMQCGEPLENPPWDPDLHYCENCLKGNGNG